MMAILSSTLAAMDKPSNENMSAESTGSEPYYTESKKTDFLAATLIGSRVYATTTNVDVDQAVETATPERKDIGEINNIILSRDGNVKAVVLGVGGFLGVSEKDVAVKISELKFFKKSGDDADDYFIVVNSDKAGLEKAPAFKRVKS